MHINGEQFSVKGYIVSIPFAIEGGGGANAFQHFLERTGRWFERPFLEGGLMGKRWSIFGGRFSVFRDSNYEFYLTTLI